MTTHLHGISAQFYRGIGNDEQKLSRLTKFNFFVGENNSGKSTILKLLAHDSPFIRTISEDSALDPIAHKGPQSGPFRFAIGFQSDEVFEKSKIVYQEHPTGLRILLRRLIDVMSFDGLVYIPFIRSQNLGLSPDYNSLISKMEPQLTHQEWNDLDRNCGSSSGGSLTDQVTKILRLIVDRQQFNLPSVFFIPALRSIGDTGQQLDDLSGKGLIDRLAQHQNPGLDPSADRKVFDRINSFLRDVLDRSSAQIEVPHDRRHVLVHMDGKALPLASLGTGVQEVILIASFCTMNDGAIMCIEEPETHLHPTLQKKLVRYLQENTSSQYFISTHSASFIDTFGATIFHVSNDGVQTKLKGVELEGDKFRLCQTLGYRASDIIQANYVIWVEGPSDRTYLKWWLREVAPSFKEGIHYSIMFYGGRLLSHLSAADDEVEGFIKLRALNRNVAILIDSDKSSAQSHLNPTKKRIREEFSDSGGFCWITRGREVENYLDPVKLEAATREVHPSVFGSPLGYGQYENTLQFTRRGPKIINSVYKDADKVKIAGKMAQGHASLDILDLRKQINSLAAIIAIANTH